MNEDQYAEIHAQLAANEIEHKEIRRRLDMRTCCFRAPRPCPARTEPKRPLRPWRGWDQTRPGAKWRRRICRPAGGDAMQDAIDAFTRQHTAPQ